MTRLALMHLAANAVLLSLGYYWLGVGESTTVWLIVSFVLALFLLLFASLAYGATFAYFQQDQPEATSAWRWSLRKLSALVVCGAVSALVYWALANWTYVFSKPAFPIASWLTLKLQKPIRPASVERIFVGLLWLIRWVLVPVYLLPVAAAVAVRGWEGFRSRGLMIRKLYWLQAPVLLLAVFWLPLKLIAWVPSLKSFPLETVSAALRLGFAYLLFTVAWLALAFVTSAGRPRVIQPNTVSSP